MDFIKIINASYSPIWKEMTHTTTKRLAKIYLEILCFTAAHPDKEGSFSLSGKG